MTGTSRQNILAIDTSTRHLKLALGFGGDRLVKSRKEVEKSHGQLIIKRIDALLQSAGLVAKELEAIVVCTGPGSFTGLRIGLAAAKGIASALGLPVVGVNLFEVAAHRFRNEDKRVHVVIPLNRDECFMAAVENGLYNDHSTAIIPYRNLVPAVGEDWVAGIGLEPARQFSELKHVDVSNQLDYDGSDLLYLGQQKLLAGIVDDPVHLEPLYVRKSEAELKFDRRQRKQ